MDTVNLLSLLLGTPYLSVPGFWRGTCCSLSMKVSQAEASSPEGPLRLQLKPSVRVESNCSSRDNKKKCQFILSQLLGVEGLFSIENANLCK